MSMPDSGQSAPATSAGDANPTSEAPVTDSSVGETGDTGAETDVWSSNPFLKNVPDEHKPIVEPYLQQWNQGFTTYSQKRAEQVKQWESLGDLETVQARLKVAELLQTDPGTVAKFLKENADQFGIADLFTPPPPAQPEDNTWRDGLPPQILERLDKTQSLEQQFAQAQQMLQVLGSHVAEQQRREKEAQEDAAFNGLLDELEGKFGKYDRDLVIPLIASGLAPDVAVQRVQEKFQEFVNERAKSAPPPNKAMGARPGAPSSFDPAKASDGDRRAFIAQAIKGLNGNG